MNRNWVLVSILIVLFLSAMEATIVTTAMKTIVDDLKGMELMNMTFSVYLLITAVTTPIYGKLADLYGRKRVLMIAIAIFLLGSVLCGAAATMQQLVLFRAVQALGAGAIFPVTMTIIGDIYTPEEQTRLQGIFSGVWALSSIVGPLIGGLIVEFADWRWIFLLNLPLGLAALLLLSFAYRETFQPAGKSIDWLGAVSFLASISSLLIVLLFGGESGFLSPVHLLLAALFVLFGIVFIAVERRVSEPFMPLDLFRNRVILIPNLFSFLAYAFPIATTVYFPLWLQTLKHQSPIVSGFAVAIATVGWPLGATAAGKLMKRVPPKRVAVLGAGLLGFSGLMLSTITTATPVPVFFVIMLLAGFGLGLCRTVLMILMQNAVENRQRGIAMSTSALMNTLGQTVFIAVFGVVFNASASASEIAGLAHGIHVVFVCVAVVTVLAFLVSLWLPGISNRDLFGDGKDAAVQKNT
ncbi:MDR family MFS transporter [Paenibacillus ehimensis]|uniref:MDR family MFS transporter n=1 Tax=Paenibacillus ehimensis TaxID=79264 RepID=A0ABT8VD46_9BACL|nr:MDR family MFS transporter [Paenibacillus ehimensis]MDO3678884.1 MDR family MFS transporter [Paenibacillus ehimensis]